MSELKQIKCPSCGAGMSLKSPYEIVLECPYCHSQVINESAYQSKDNLVDSKVLPFSWTEDIIMKSFSDHLFGIKDTPTDVFTKIRITDFKKYYVPMYIFHGSFRAPWTAKVPRYQKRVGVNDKGELKEKEEVVYDYVSGEAVGNFTFNSIPEQEIQNIGINLPVIQNININTAKCIPLSSLKIKQEDNIEYLSPSGNADEVWNESAQAMAQNEAYATAMSQCPNSNQSNSLSFLKDISEILGNDHKSEIVSCSACCEMKKASLIFIPIWRIEYEYDNDKYYFVSYAEQDEKWSLTYPKRIEKIKAYATDEQKAMLNAYKEEIAPINKFTRWGCGGLFIIEILTIFGITSFFESLNDDNWGWYFPIAGLIFLIIWYIIGEKKKKEFEVDKINADIAKRTRKMTQASLEYKKQTCERFMQSKAWENSTPLNASDLTDAYMESFDALKTAEEPNSQTSPLYNNTNNSESNTKYCKQCGKKIETSHTFCRYCGSKQ